MDSILRKSIPVLLWMLVSVVPASADRTPESLSISPSTLIGGTVDRATAAGTVTITGSAPPNSNWPVYLNSSNSHIILADGLNICYVPPNQSSCSFSVRATSTSVPINVTVTATSNNESITTNVTVEPNEVVSFSISPGALWGGTGQEATGTISIAHAMTSAVNFSFSTDHSGLLKFPVNTLGVPYARIEAGAQSTSFPISANNVSETTLVNVTTSCFFGSQSTSVTVFPRPASPDGTPGPCPDGNCEGGLGSPINLTNGNVWVQQRDYSLPGLGGGLEIVRTWNSLWASSSPPDLIGMFGRSWRGNYEERLVVAAGKPLSYWRGDGSVWSFLWNASGNNWYLASPANQRAWIVFDPNSTLYTLTFLDGSRRVFNNAGYLVALLDRNGNQTTITLNGSNRIAQVTDPAGRSLTFTYNASLLVTSAQDSVGNIATYTYDGSKRPTKVTYADGSFNTFTWDGANRLLNVKDTNAKILEAHTYSTNKGLTSERAGGVERVTLSYPSGGNVTNITDSLGNTTTYYHSAFSGPYRFVTEIVGPGCTTCGGRGDSVFSYDGGANRTASTDALGRTTSCTYDSMGNVTSRSVQLDINTTLTWSYTYNSFGQVLTATDPLGNVTSNTYDLNGNLLSTSAGGSTTSFQYNLNGLLAQVTDPQGNPTTFTYTPAGLLASVTDALGNTTTYGYDGRGNRTSVIDALSNTTAFTYDVMNRLTLVTYPDNTTTAFAYDNRGRRTSVTDANGRVTSYAYDDADRLISVTDAANNVTSYAYDTENNLTSITDALGRVTSFAYDALGRVTSTTFPSTLAESYAYDSVGNLLSKTDRKAQTISYTYDNLNRLTRKDYPASSGVDYTYDDAGRLVSVEDSTGTYEFTYDNLSRLVGASTTYSFLPSRTFTISYSYDEVGNRISMLDPESGATDYTYDALNRLTSLSNFQSQMFTFSYDQLSRRTQLTRPNGVNTAYSYDNLSRLLSVLHQLGGNTIDGATYTVDGVGNRTAKTNQLNAVTEDYTYDAIYQLTQVVQGMNTTESYSYDAVGNRISSLGVSPYTYNSSNQLNSTPSATFTYDDNGNTLTKTEGSDTTTYAWDFENRLTAVTLPDQSVVTFKYDPFGRRIQKVAGSSTTVFVYDGANIIEEVDSSGLAVARYTQGLGIDEPLAMLRGGATHYYQADGLGSIHALGESSGTLAASYTYDSFGNLTASSGSVVNPFRFTARESDSDSGLYFYRARSYDALTGRFLSEDPFTGDGNYSLYSYVMNNPANLIDPSGMLPEQPCECKGNTGGVRVALKCCLDAPPVSSDTGPRPYDPCFSYLFVNANFMYRHGGDTDWGQIVRGCLLCSYRYGTDSSAAHAICYGSASKRSFRWWDPFSVRANYGLGRAVGAASLALGLQAVDYLEKKGQKPFPCLNVQ